MIYCRHLLLFLVLCLELLSDTGSSDSTNHFASQSVSVDSCHSEQNCDALHCSRGDGCPKEFDKVREFFEDSNKELRQRCRRTNLAAYAYSTNVSEINRLSMIDEATKNSIASKKLADDIRNRGYDKSTDENIKRQAKILSDIGDTILPEDDYKRLQDAISNMQTNYATATVCSYNGSQCDLPLEPNIQERIANCRDAKELQHYWVEWYNKAGTPMRGNFSDYVQLTNKAAKLNNYFSCAEYWIHFYDDPDFEQNVYSVYQKILPFYKEIHAYVRYYLHQHYGDIVPEKGNIPMHLLGNLWAQQWDQAIDLYTPFREKPFVDYTDEMKRQKYTVEKMFRLGEDFFTSLGMLPLPSIFWNASVLERPSNMEIICHASAWDLYEDGDVRIKMCTEVDTHYLYVVHHELGHIQYYLQYKDQATVFRDAPNPGFHEAVGDVIALSVSSTQHLEKIGLSKIARLDEESRINELFRMALQKVVFLPFAYVMDEYRYMVFREEISEECWQCTFWQMRSKLTGVEPPVQRSNHDFDPPAKYHLSAHVEYMRYFTAHIFQFQFHKAMCQLAGQYVPNNNNLTLDNCDIYNSKVAGKAFSEMLSLGSSKPWRQVLSAFTGNNTMDPEALLEYFEPLWNWLSAKNKELGVTVGWEDEKKDISTACKDVYGS